MRLTGVRHGKALSDPRAGVSKPGPGASHPRNLLPPPLSVRQRVCRPRLRVVATHYYFSSLISADCVVIDIIVVDITGIVAIFIVVILVVVDKCPPPAARTALSGQHQARRFRPTAAPSRHQPLPSRAPNPRQRVQP